MARDYNLLFLLGFPVVVAVTACTSGSAPLALTAVDPALARLGVATALELRGAFPSSVVVDYADANRNRVDVAFGVTVGDLSAEGVVYVDATTLSAVAPAGLVVGIHDVSVRDPRGRTVTLPAAFTMVDGACLADGSDPDADGDGMPDCSDLCPHDPDKIAPGVCGCGVPDVDANANGTADCLENDSCPDDPNKTTAGICGCGVADTDTDTDGTPDCNDGCPSDPDKVAPGGCGCGVADTDTDTDGTPDCSDACPDDPAKTAAGRCGCGVADTDTDSDGTPDCNDGCPSDPDKRTAGFCGCGVADTDTDSDGTADCNDGCPGDPDKIAAGACGCGVADTDTDLDGTPDCNDGCPSDPDKTAPGACGCGVADTDANTNGTPDCLEADGCPTDPGKTAPGICGCGVPDTDTDTDGTPDCNDGCPNDINKTAAGACGCGAADTDTDGDGTADCVDGCPNDPAKITAGTCGCGNTATGCAAGFCTAGACASGCNVLTNGSEQLGNFNGWTLTQQCGDGWHTEGSYCDVRQAPEQNDGWVAFTSYYVTSSDWCKREQVIDLVAMGFSTTLLDSAPTIQVGEWVRTNCFDTDGFRMTVELQKANGHAIVTWDTGAMSAPADWALQAHTFSGYGTGLRKIRFSDQGRDTSLWAGYFGAALDGAYATIMGATCP